MSARKPSGALTRRTVLSLTAASAAALAAGRPAFATMVGEDGSSEGLVHRHALTVFGEPQHGPDFSHFPYVNPDAPKGGEIKYQPSSWLYNQNVMTFNTFNTFTLRGDAPPLMEEMCFSALMVRSFDEPDAVYGAIAETVAVDGNDCVFTLRNGPTFSDGSPITAEDVVFSYLTLKEKAHPQLRILLEDVLDAKAEDERTVRITLSEGASNRLLPLIASVPPILSKAYYEANDFEAARLDIPVGSGPYTIGDFQAGRYLVYQKREDWWGDDVAGLRGHFNFDRVRIDFFRERTASFEAFKTGAVTFREEFTAKTWMTEYDFPALREGRVVKTTFPDGRPSGAQGFFINTRRKKFADPRTREALGYAFDFEWMNQNLFYGLYKRTFSYFMNSDLLATGTPSEAELALLEPYREELAPQVFGEAVTPPVSDGSGRDRALLRRATELLAEAGWERRDGGWFSPDDGEQLTVEFLYAQPRSERVNQPYAGWLGRIGIPATLRQVESAQYQSRLNAFDFDLVTRRFSMTPTPGESIRALWTSRSANQEGTYNLAGISDPVVDALTEVLINAPDRETLVTAGHAIDRVLRAGHYWVPQWYNPAHNVAYWDAFGIPDKPRYELPVATTWWSKDA